MAPVVPEPSGSLEGKVAAVLNERELAINIGSSHGVTVGMKFKVLAEKPIELQDPDSKEELGLLDREKVRVEAIDVKPKFSVCRTYRTRTVGGINFSFIDIMSERREVPETLKAQDAAYPPPLSEEESYVKRGDRVVQLTTRD